VPVGGYWYPTPPINPINPAAAPQAKPATTTPPKTDARMAPTIATEGNSWVFGNK
jgi:hypothetical protein